MLRWKNNIKTTILFSFCLILANFNVKNYSNLNVNSLIVDGKEYVPIHHPPNRRFQNKFHPLPFDKIFIQSTQSFSGQRRKDQKRLSKSPKLFRKRFLSSDTKHLMRKVSVASNSEIHDDYVSQQFKWSNRIKSSNDWRPSYWRPDIQYHEPNMKSTNQNIVNIIPELEGTKNAGRSRLEAKSNKHQRHPLIRQKPLPQHQPWISKLETTVYSLKQNIRQKFSQLLDTSTFSVVKPLLSDRSSKASNYNPNRQGLSRVGIIGSPLAAVFSSLITSLSITSLAFTRELVFGETMVIPGQNSSSSSSSNSHLTSLKLPFVSAIYALSEVVTSGIRSFLNIPGGDNGSSDKRYRQAVGHSDKTVLDSCSAINCVSNVTDGCVNGKCTCGGGPACSGTTDFCSLGVCTCGGIQGCKGNSDACSFGKCRCDPNHGCGSPSLTYNICETSQNSKCVCGSSSNKCNLKSTQPRCLDSNGRAPRNDDLSATCKCTGRLTKNDSCVHGIGLSLNKPLCGNIGVCEECQANRDGSGGRGTGFTQGTCQDEYQVCCPSGECKRPPC